jgi:hypothetical protein
VAVRALDQFGVPVLADVAVTRPVNGEPFIRLVNPMPTTTPVGDRLVVPIFTEVQLAAGLENDFLPDEPVTFTWKVTAPGGAELPHTPCAGASPPAVKICFQPPAAGPYGVELSILEGGISRAAKPFALQAEDRPPCIKATNPAFEAGGRLLGFEQLQRDFAVLAVDDDGDPLPAPLRPTERDFIWYVKQPGSKTFDRLVSERRPSFIIPPRRYQALQRIEVRLEYRDRVGVANPAARSLAHCHEDDRLCAIPGDSACYQWVTWTVEYQ